MNTVQHLRLWRVKSDRPPCLLNVYIEQNNRKYLSYICLVFHVDQKEISNRAVGNVDLFIILFILLCGYVIANLTFGAGLPSSPSWELSIWTIIHIIPCDGLGCLLPMIAMSFIYNAMFAGLGVVTIRRIQRRAG